jgi:hypothetical protein
MIRRRNNDSVRDDNVGSVPPCRHCAAKRIEDLLCLPRDTLSTPRFALLQFSNGAGFSSPQGSNVKRMHRRYGVGEGGPFRGVGIWSKRQELE